MEHILEKLEGIAAELRANHHSREELNAAAHRVEAAVADLRNKSGESEAVLKAEGKGIVWDTRTPGERSPIKRVEPIEEPEELKNADPNPPISSGAPITDGVAQ